MKRAIRRPHTVAALAVAASGLLLAAPGYASTLQTADLNNPGDNLLTIDTNTGLEFVDPSATENISYNDTLQNPLVTQHGFRIATQDEFMQLLTDAGFTDFSGDFNVADEAPAEILLNNFLGETIPPGQPFTIAGTDISDGFYSFTSTPSTSPGTVNVVGVDYQSAALDQAPQDQARAVLSLNQLPVDQPSKIAGGLLVRSADIAAVPEPSGAGLMGLALAMMAGMGFVRRRRQHAAR